MGLINVTDATDGDAVNAALINDRIGPIVDELNGGLDDDNIAVNANIDPAKVQPIPVKSRLIFSGACATKNTTQSIPNGAATTVVFETEDYDTDSYHSTSSNTSRLVVPVTGYYHITGYIELASWASGSAGSRLIVTLRINNVDFLDLWDSNFWNTAEPALSVSQDKFLTAGDYIELVVYQGSGSSRNITSATRLQIYCLGV